ncbi:MAG TPA: hypothetical protein EYO58_10835 [Flavobacteriales bacterium]|nr:hypothetical protein [Flavobacteriales bacterium]
MMYTNKSNPVLKFPHRSALQLTNAIKPYIEGKVICDLGCACGDLLYSMKGTAKDIVGVERNLEHKKQINFVGADRDFIIWGDLFEIGVPPADIYFLWISSDIEYNKRVIDMLDSNKLIIDAASRLDLFKDFKNINLVDIIEYEYDETNCYDDTVDYFEPIGTRKIRIYRKII